MLSLDIFILMRTVYISVRAHLSTLVSLTLFYMGFLRYHITLEGDPPTEWSGDIKNDLLSFFLPPIYVENMSNSYSSGKIRM